MSLAQVMNLPHWEWYHLLQQIGYARLSIMHQRPYFASGTHPDVIGMKHYYLFAGRGILNFSAQVFNLGPMPFVL